MEIHITRLNALRAEIQRFPTLAAFSRNYQLDTTYVSQLLNGHRNIGEKAARTLEKKLGWPSMFMDHYCEDPTDNRAERQPVAWREKPIHTPETHLQRVPLISSVQAGLWREAVNPYTSGGADDYLFTHMPLGPESFALTVRGESMLPEFREGDLIIIDPQVQPAPGDFVVAKNDEDEATFKKYRPRGVNERGESVIELVPLNEDFPVLRSDFTSIQIIGTLMEHRRYRRRS